MKQSSVLLTALVSATMMSQPAHAGLSEWVNDYFTFREDQKPLVKPNHQLPPKHVITPNYNDHEASKWNRYYTRQDLQPVQNFDSSSMVMRPRDLELERLKALEEANRTPYGDSVNGQYQQQPSYQSMERRDYINRANEVADNRIFIGEPGRNPVNPDTTDANLGAKMMIGDPKRSWKDKGDGTYAQPRVGDYDYARDYSFGAQPWQQAQTNQLAGQQTQSASGAMPNNTPNSYTGIQAPQGYQASLADKPTNYIVEQDDTLSGISGKDKIYGDWKMWPLIYDANRTQIQDPDLIHPGQDLGIPRDYTQENAYDARQRATRKQAPYSFYDNQ